jgi:tetratricopeptide (TPR) repeat protein
MQWQTREPQYTPNDTGTAVVLESEPVHRDAALEKWLHQARDANAETWRLQCAPQIGGIWAGLADLVESLIARIQHDAPDLLVAYSYEISLVLPQYRHQLQVSRPLTDTASPEERTRNYPADRAYRSLHGLINLLGEWHSRSGGRPWAIACDNYDGANALVQRFFTELVRRRGHHLRLQLLVAVGPGQGDDIAAGFATTTVTEGFRPSWKAQRDVAADPNEMTQRAAVLEAQVKGDETNHYVDLPRLIHYWQHSTQPARALRWRVVAVNVFNHLGLYEAAREHADEIEANLDAIAAEDSHQYLLAVNGLYFCWVTLGQAERARYMTENALGRLDRSALPRVYYLVAMLYARFLEPQDLTMAEDYLRNALDLVADAELPEDDRQFMTVFLMNGLALVRVRQHRPEEALALCQVGLDRLRQHLDPNQHRLHRSVLLYNIAQVYAQIGPFDQALDYFSQTMELDPNYSEYYNERGAVYYKMGRLREAEADFVAAIRLSPPYAEVWVNLGQCYRATGRMEEAVAAYSQALDLEPSSALARAGRADAHASLGRSREALDDYHEALLLDPSQPLVWAGRAVVYYEQRQIQEALDDLNRAVALAPDIGELRQNRAVALQDLGRAVDAAADLRSYLELCPDADDRAEVGRQLESLQLATAS